MDEDFKILKDNELLNYYLSCITESTEPNFPPFSYKTDNHQEELKNWITKLFNDGGVENVIEGLEKAYFFLKGDLYYSFPFSYWSDYEENDDNQELYGLILIPTPKETLTLYSYYVSEMVGLYGIPFNKVEVFNKIPKEDDLLIYLNEEEEEEESEGP